MNGVYSGIQWNIYVKPFDISPPLAVSPSLRSGLIWALGDQSIL